MTSAPTTPSPPHRKLAAAILAVFALQLAFVTVGGAVVSETEIDASATAISEMTNPVNAAPAVAPTGTSEGAEVVGDGGSATVASADAQRPPLEIPYYLHPFLPDECFWYCMERRCPCVRIFP